MLFVWALLNNAKHQFRTPLKRSPLENNKIQDTIEKKGRNFSFSLSFSFLNWKDIHHSNRAPSAFVSKVLRGEVQRHSLRDQELCSASHRRAVESLRSVGYEASGFLVWGLKGTRIGAAKKVWIFH